MYIVERLKMSETRRKGLTMVILGALVLISAALAYSYQQTTTEMISPGFSLGGQQIMQPIYHEVTTTPYKDYTTPLILGGIALFPVGFALMLYHSRNLQ
jgi:hypothetical protein